MHGAHCYLRSPSASKVSAVNDGTIPPSVGGFSTPCWESLAEEWDATPAPMSTTITLGPATVQLGHDDYEADDGSLDVRDHEFGGTMSIRGAMLTWASSVLTGAP
jgi:hypothetical protein